MFCVLLGLATPSLAQQSGSADVSIESDIARAQTLYEGGRIDQAMSLVDRVLERAGGNAEARFLKALILAGTERREEAIDMFVGLTTDYPELPEPWNNLAVLFAENGEFDKARQALLAAIQTHPSYSTAHENLGDLYARMASMAYDRALEQDRANQSARLKLSAVNGLFTVPTQAAAAPAPTRVATTSPTSRPAPTPARVPPSSEPEILAPVTTTAAVRPTPAVPRPGPGTVAATPVVNENDIENAILAWGKAWSAQDVDNYLGSYAPNFRPANGASRASWSRYRRDRLTAPSFIQVDISDMSIEVQSGVRAKAVFTQRYRSDNYEDQVRKTLDMVLVNGRWRIATETSE
ncbi:MAG: tetratricopeptide repeat protein [Pseudomonadota bacterium]